MSLHDLYCETGAPMIPGLHYYGSPTSGWYHLNGKRIDNHLADKILTMQAWLWFSAKHDGATLQNTAIKLTSGRPHEVYARLTLEDGTEYEAPSILEAIVEAVR